MTEQPRPLGDIASYHAHIYYDPATTRAEAERLRGWIAERFLLRVGAWHDQPVGPHGQAMFQAAFAPELFPSFVPWLMLNHGSLTVMVHPNTRNMHRDHVDDAIWIGPPIELRPEILKHENEAELAPDANTTPRLDADNRPSA